MPKVSNTIIYPQDDNLSMDDYTIGTNSNTGNKKTQTYAFKSIFSLFYNFLGYNAFFNTTDTTTYPIGTPGCFYVFDENDVLTTDFSEARKITFSAYDTYNFDTANYFNIIVSSGKFLFKLINLEDKNNFVFLSPSNFVLSGTGTTFNVDVLAEAGLSNGSFVNYKRYLLVLEFAAGTFNPADYDLTDFTNTSGNPFVTAQDLTDALALLPNPITNHSGLSLDDGTNPHGTTKGDVGLGNVPNVDTSITSNISEGSNLYFTTARVLATVLSGLSLATGGAIVSTDSILVAFGKIQKQIDDLTTSIGNKLDKVSTAGVERAYIINADGSQGTKATSYFKDVLEFTNLAAFPATGETGKIYLALDINKTYRWSGSAYVQIGGNPKKSIEYNVTSLCTFNFPATSNWTLAGGTNGMGAYGSARSDSAYSNFLSLIASSFYTRVIGGIAPFNMKLTSNSSFVTPEPNLVGGDLKLVVGYIELNYATGAITNATLVDAGTYTPATGGRVDLREDFGGEITIPKGAIWCYSWAHTKTSAVSGVYIQTILNFEEV